MTLETRGLVLSNWLELKKVKGHTRSARPFSLFLLKDKLSSRYYSSRQSELSLIKSTRCHQRPPGGAAVPGVNLFGRRLPDDLQVKLHGRVLLRQLMHTEAQLCQHLSNHSTTGRGRSPIREQEGDRRQNNSDQSGERWSSGAMLALTLVPPFMGFPRSHTTIFVWFSFL